MSAWPSRVFLIAANENQLVHAQLLQSTCREGVVQTMKVDFESNELVVMMREVISTGLLSSSEGEIRRLRKKTDNTERHV